MEPDAIGLTNDMIAILEKLFPGDEKVPRVAPAAREAGTTAANHGLETGTPHA